MPRPRPPHLHREKTRHGKTVWYFRLPKGPRIRIRAEFGTPQFDAEYQAAVSGSPKPKRGNAKVGSLAWLIARYPETPAWLSFSLATRRQRENIMRQVIDKSGHQPYDQVTQA